MSESGTCQNPMSECERQATDFVKLYTETRGTKEFRLCTDCSAMAITTFQLQAKQITTTRINE